MLLFGDGFYEASLRVHLVRCIQYHRLMPERSHKNTRECPYPTVDPKSARWMFCIIRINAVDFHAKLAKDPVR